MNISPSYLSQTLAIPLPPLTAELSSSTTSTPSLARHTRSIDASALGPTHESDAAKNVIYGSTTATPPNTNLTQKERLQLTEAYAGRIVQQLANIESGSEGESNLKFQQSRQFLQPASYFSGGVLAAGFDPQAKITVTLNTYVGVGAPTTLTSRVERSYFAWEVAAGALAHDKTPRGGPVNFHSMHIEQKDKSRVEDLESVGSKLQDHWENEISEPLRDVSGALAKRSGKADAYVVRGTLQSLRGDKASFEKLTPGSRDAIDRTLDKLGNVVIPNIFGYPMAGYAFVPEVNYHGDYDHRPNKGLMIDLKNGTVNEIHGDKDFADWAKNNRSAIVRSFNASDRQGGKNSHWPKAADVLDNLIIGNLATYRGRSGALSDKDVPVWETFNYTQSRDADYYLNFGNLNGGIAASYQEVNTKNAVWTDQTEVFGSSQQTWKGAKDLWNNTFGYVPIVGNTGNIVFGIHDSLHGMTADDRVGGNAAAVISALQLAHELAPAAIETGLGDLPIALELSTPRSYSWRLNEQTRDFDLVRAPTASNDSVIQSNELIPPAPHPSIDGEEPQPGPSGNNPVFNRPVPTIVPVSRSLILMEPYAVADGEQLISNATRDAMGVYRMTDSSGIFRQFVRLTDETNTSRVFEISGRYRSGEGLAKIIDPKTRANLAVITAGRDGDWIRAPADGGAPWPWQRSNSPTPSIEPKNTLISAQFLEIDGAKMNGATTLDKYLNPAEHEYTYGIAVNDKGKGVPQISWSTEENPAHATPHPTASASAFGTSSYSEQFIKDINRSAFTVNTPDGVSLEIDIPAEIKALQLARGTKLTTEELDTLIHNAIEKFENAIPDPALRARISEVANQWLLGAAPEEFQTSRFKDTIYASGRDPHYYIDYDPHSEITTVTAKSDFILTKLELDGELETLKDVTAKASRPITIRASNSIDSDGYDIEPSAPTRIEITPTLN